MKSTATQKFNQQAVLQYPLSISKRSLTNCGFCGCALGQGFLLLKLSVVLPEREWEFKWCIVVYLSRR